MASTRSLPRPVALSPRARGRVGVGAGGGRPARLPGAGQQPPTRRVRDAPPEAPPSAGCPTAGPVEAALANPRLRRVLRPLLRAARSVARQLPPALKQP